VGLISNNNGDPLVKTLAIWITQQAFMAAEYTIQGTATPLSCKKFISTKLRINQAAESTLL
jgi:hypothetical protein